MPETIAADLIGTVLMNPQFRPSGLRDERAQSLFLGNFVSESGRRYCNPQLGRWLGRDPIEEKGGLHLYGFVGNNGVKRWDALGIRWVTRYKVDPSDPNEGREAYRVWEEIPFIVSEDRIDDSWERERMIDAHNASRSPTANTSPSTSSGGSSAEEQLLNRLNREACLGLKSNIEGRELILKRAENQRIVGYKWLLNAPDFVAPQFAGVSTADTVDILTNIASLAGKNASKSVDLMITSLGFYSGTAANGYNAIASAATGDSLGAYANGFQAVGNGVLSFSALAEVSLAVKAGPLVAAAAIIIKATEQGVLVYLDKGLQSDELDFWKREISSAETDIEKYSPGLARARDEWKERVCSNYGL